MDPLVAEIKDLASRIGFTACGIASVEPFDQYREAVRARMERFPEAASLYADMLRRTEPRTGTPWARSIVVCMRRYGKYRLPERLARHFGRNYLFDRRVKSCPDNAMTERMKQGLVELGMRVRSGGVPDRPAAQRAGVARIGRNGFAYTENGSWANIQTWLVDAQLPADEPTLDSPCPDGCCACMEACPTGAIVEPYVMRMDRCVAWLTYSASGPIESPLWQSMGPWIYGCDACQLACPLNRGKWDELEDAPWLEGIAPQLLPERLATMDEDAYQSVVHPYFWYIPASDLGRWHRNAARALACPDNPP